MTARWPGTPLAILQYLAELRNWRVTLYDYPLAFRIAREEMEEKLLELVAKLEALAPQVWSLAVRQVLVDAVRQLVVGLFALAVAVVIALFSIKQARKVQGSPSEDDITWYLFGVGIGTGFLLS